MTDSYINIKKGFTQIDSSWIEDKKLSDGAFRTLVTLKSFQFGTNKIFPSIETLAIKRGKSKTTIINHLNELRDKKYIVSKRRGYSCSNIYTIISQKNFTNENNNNQKYNTTINQKSYSHKSNIFEPNNKTNNINLINDNNSLRGHKLKITTDEIRKRFPWMERKNK